MQKKRKRCHCLIAMMLVVTLVVNHVPVYAKSIYDAYTLYLRRANVTVYLNQTVDFFEPGMIIATYMGNYSDAQYDKASEKIRKDLLWKSSDPSVVAFVTNTTHESDGSITYESVGKIKPQYNSVRLLGKSEGTATITLTSKRLSQTLKCKVTVKNAELKCDDEIFYESNHYSFEMRGNVASGTFTSSNPAVATVDEESGAVTTKKKGTTVISCLGEDGKTYKKKIKVQKRGLSYKKLTTYYYTGFRKGCYTHFPLVAKGVKVKKWKSSNKKVCKVVKTGKNGNLGLLRMLGTGKTTITCVAKDGKKFKCKLTVVGGKPWGGLNSGYRPTVSMIKKHGYYKDINTVMDYGDVVVYIEEYDHEINLKNGNKRLTEKAKTRADQILTERYPDARIQSPWGDYLCFTSDNGKKGGRLSVGWYYVEK